jgi:2-C-methyl-D-erythritol 4-phosphate cytidylyltransferase
MTVALLLAAGSGERLGADRPKAFVHLAGRPLLAWSVDALAGTESVEQIVVALPAGGTDAFPRGSETSPAGIARWPAGMEAVSSGVSVAVEAVEGGSSRSQSVKHALAAAREDELVLVHDAARPLLTAALAGSVIAALREDPHAQAAIAATPVTDTIKRAADSRIVLETLDRSELWAVQTPQVFRREALTRALAAPPEELARATDDAWLIEQAGGRVIVAPSPAENIKVTTAVDLRLAELLLQARATQP